MEVVLCVLALLDSEVCIESETGSNRLSISISDSVPMSELAKSQRQMKSTLHGDDGEGDVTISPFKVSLGSSVPN
jgi:hypothetical protein